MNGSTRMNNQQDLDVPVVLIIFNRPKTTEKVFEQIRKVKPPELFIVADGPRDNIETDQEQCEKARNVIHIDWDCTVYYNYAETNMGLRKRFSSGLDWVFQKVDEAIILEDDCLPNDSFFYFCEKMLDTYRDDKRIMNITGTNLLEKWKAGKQDYHFSVLGGIWGWATWKESWELYDPDMELWDDVEIQERIRDVIADESQFYYRKKMYDMTHNKEIDTWDFQWSFTRLINSGLTVVPAKNTISNIGFGESATNLTGKNSDRANIPRHQLSFPLSKNEHVAPDRQYDKKMYKLDKHIFERVIYKYLLKLDSTRSKM